MGHRWVEKKMEAFHERFNSTKTKIFTFVLSHNSPNQCLTHETMDFTYEVINDQNANTSTHDHAKAF
jgi:hypothetical protein